MRVFVIKVTMDVFFCSPHQPMSAKRGPNGTENVPILLSGPEPPMTLPRICKFDTTAILIHNQRSSWLLVKLCAKVWCHLDHVDRLPVMAAENRWNSQYAQRNYTKTLEPENGKSKRETIFFHAATVMG